MYLVGGEMRVFDGDERKGTLCGEQIGLQLADILNKYKT